MERIGKFIGYLGLASSLALSVALFFLVFQRSYDPGVVNGAMAMWSVAWVALALMIYVALQAATALTHPGRELTFISFMDITLSLIPLILCLLAIYMQDQQIISLTNFQQVVLALVFAATIIDLLFFCLVVLVRPPKQEKDMKALDKLNKSAGAKK